jgi:hypothetical protein
MPGQGQRFCVSGIVRIHREIVIDTKTKKPVLVITQKQGICCNEQKKEKEAISSRETREP